MAHKQAQLDGRAMGSSKSMLSVAAAVVARPPLMPASAMGLVNDHCVAHFPHLESLHVQFIFQ